MENPKVSVLIPMYNRKHYIARCVDSILSQTFQDFEIIIRDNCSTDGGVEFIQEKYAKEIAEGKLKIFVNEENLGEYGNVNTLVKDATGKYFLCVHSDDTIFENAIDYLYNIAEKTSADVVHSSKYISAPDTEPVDTSKFKVITWDNTTSDKIVVMPNDLSFRFKEWFYRGTFWDIQYNLFNREFAVSNEIFTDRHDYFYSCLWWLMLAKVFVKVPKPYYIHFAAPDALSSKPLSYDLVERILSDTISACNDFEKLFSKLEFFGNNEMLQYMVKARYISLVDTCNIIDRRSHKNGLTPELYEIFKKVFKKHFGDSNYFYPMFMYQWAHCLQFNQKPYVINFDKSAASL